MRLLGQTFNQGRRFTNSTHCPSNSSSWPPFPPSAGPHLVRRWEEEDGVNLYHLPGGFFVELYYDSHANELVRLRSFSSAVPLEDYAAYVQLPTDE